MNNKSIKNQLTFLYASILIIVTTVLFLTFYTLTSRYLIYETDRSLILHASQLVNTLEQSNNDIHSTLSQSIVGDTNDEIPGMFVEVVNKSGFKADNSPTQFMDLVIQSSKTGKIQFTSADISHFKMRVIADPIIRNEENVGVVLMGHPIDVYQNTLNQLKNVGTVLLLFLVLPSILIGYFLAKSVLKPLDNLSTEINKITTENLTNDVNIVSRAKETDLLVRNFNSLLKRIDTAFNLERQFLGELAHEIKTPLSVIKSNSEVILTKERTTEEYKNSIEQTLKQIDNLSSSMHSLMDFAWAQTQNIDKTFKKMDLSGTLNDLITVAKYMSQAKEIKVKADIQPNIKIVGKEEKIYQAIYNIIDNAVKFTDNKGQINISLKSSDTSAIIKILDTGIGIERSKLNEIFNRFYRSEKNKNISGHGLGLAIADSIIKAHKGTIQVQSIEGKGSTFVISLNISS